MGNSISMSTASRCSDVFLPLYLAFVGPHLESCAQFGAPQCKKSIGTLEQIRQRTPRWSEARTREIQGEAETAGSVHPSQEKAQGETFALPTTTWAEDRTRFVLVVYSNRVRAKGLKVEHGELRLDTKKRFLTLRVIKHWERGPERLWNHHLWRC